MKIKCPLLCYAYDICAVVNIESGYVIEYFYNVKYVNIILQKKNIQLLSNVRINYYLINTKPSYLFYNQLFKTSHLRLCF